jgi:predicted acetylornithine/succinylornithine family transaminase
MPQADSRIKLHEGKIGSAMQTTSELLERANKVLIGNYARQPVVMVRGEGSHLWDASGKKYIDLFAGFGAGVIGHANPALIQAAMEQAEQLWHVGNTYHTIPQIELAERLNKFAFPGQAFFCHSGMEANEAAVKLARLRGAAATPKRWKVVSMNRSFHGRSLAMIAATGNPAVKAGFEPAVPGFFHVDLGDLEGLTASIDPEVCAVMFEPIQGEGGIYPADPQYVAEVRRICDERGITLIFDEVWTGCGRTGKWFGHQHNTHASGEVILPDILTLGKAIGGGLPVGVMFARPEIASLLVPGKHGCTLGGNPICMNVAKTIFDVIERDDLLAHAHNLGESGMKRLREDDRLKDRVVEVRGKGLFIGIELAFEPKKFLETALERGIIANLTSKKIIRVAPPINISREDWKTGMDRLVQTIAALTT